MDIRDYVNRNKKIKIFYYIRGFFRLISPNIIFRRQLSGKLNHIRDNETEYIYQRVNYYNKLTEVKPLSEKAIRLRDFRYSEHQSAYFIDTFEYIRFFNPEFKAEFLFGDITYVPAVCSILKSRPIQGENSNSVLLNLDKFRHFNFLNDRKEYCKKIDKLVWRGHISETKPDRISFLKIYFNNPLCNIGNTNRWEENPDWQKERMSMAEQLDYKFILCIEGNDVATNLKWVMSSNSLAIMPKPTYETWFMEGTLKPDYHYVEIKPDFSDLEQKLEYYRKNSVKAEAIIKNAHEYINQFKNKKREKVISLLVLDKYFKMTKQ